MGNRFCNQKDGEEVQWNGIVIFFNGDNDISFNLLELTTTTTMTQQLRPRLQRPRLRYAYFKKMNKNIISNF